MKHVKDRLLSRRQWLCAGAGLLAAPVIVPSSVLGRTQRAPSERITIGVVGLGSRGFYLLKGFLNEPDTQVVAVCDVDSHHYRDKAWGEGEARGREPAKKAVEAYYTGKNNQSEHRGVLACADFRELCARDDIDAIVVATPDHWHALCTLEALDTGKDVYCEKPVTHCFAEGQAVYRKVAKKKAIFQAGSQQRSDKQFRHAVEVVLNGHLGKIKSVEVGLPEGYDKPQGSTTIETPPDHLDYDFWCGPSPVLPYLRARHHRWWRGHRAYGGGVLMDWIGHHNDIGHWGIGMDAAGPVRVEAVQWQYPETDIYNTPRHYTIRCEFPGGIESTISSNNAMGTKWIGEDGWLYVNRGEWKASDPQWLEDNFDPGPIKAYHSPGHIRNFLDACKSRKTCVAPAETAHRSITPGHLGYVSQTLKRPLEWNAAKEYVIDDKEANTLLNTMTYRKPWSL